MDPGQAQHVSRAGRLAAGLVGLVALLAVVLQYVLLLADPANGGTLAATVRFLSFFTILSNLGVVVACGMAAMQRGGRWASARWRGAVALYIGVTGLIYVTVLAALWQPQGLQWWVDNALHRLVPLLYLAWWLGWVAGRRLGLRDVAWWLLFPVCYLGWVLLRGSVVHDYPYPFVDVDAHGALGVARNAVGVTGVFVVLGLALLGLDRLRRRRGA